MQSRSFTIFHPVKKFYITPVKVYYFLLGILFFGAVLLWFFKIDNKAINNSLGGYFCLLIVIHLILFFTRGERYKALKGRLEGQITFFEDRVVINTTTYFISDIETISFEFNDYKDEPEEVEYRSSESFMYDVRPRRSQGVDNSVHLLLKSGPAIRCYFQRDYPSEKYFMADIFRAYYRANKIWKEDVMALMGLHTHADFEYFLSDPDFRVT